MSFLNCKSMEGCVHIWTVSYHTFKHSVLTHDVVRQVSVDLPRLLATVNGTRVTAIADVCEIVGEGALHKTILPFLTQTTMAHAACKLHDIYGMVLDGGQQMSIEVQTSEAEFTVDVHKSMRVAEGAVVQCWVHASSTSDDVYITCEVVPQSAQREHTSPLVSVS